MVEISGAPKGSIYQRFSTVDDLLAARASSVSGRTRRRRRPGRGGHRRRAGRVGLRPAPPAPTRGCWTPVRRKDLVAATVDATLRTELAEINGPLRTGVAALARRLYGRVTKETIA